MRNLTITRKRSFVGALIPCACIVGAGKQQIDPSDEKHPIKNGETITVPIGEAASVLAVAAHTAMGTVRSAPVVIPEGAEDVAAEVVAGYSMIKGSAFSVRLK